MKKSLSFLAIIAALAFSGCTTVHTVDLNPEAAVPDPPKQTRVESFAEINRRAKQAKRVSYVVVNMRARRKPASLTLADGRTLKVSNLQVASDSTSWFISGTGRFETVPTAEIREVRFRRGSALAGGLIGGLVGAAIGAAIGRSQGDDPVCTVTRTEDAFDWLGPLLAQAFCEMQNAQRRTAGEKALAAGMAGGALGVTVGLLIGKVAKKGKDIFRFEAPAPAPPVMTGGVEQHRPRGRSIRSLNHNE